MADDVSAALTTIGAKPQPFALKGPFSSDPGFQAGVKRLGELGGERQAAQKTFEAQSGDIEKKLAGERQAMEAIPAPKLENVGENFQHMGLKGEELTSAMQTMFAFAAIGGAMTRAPMTAALTAFSGALKGLVQGDRMVFQQEKETFDRHLKTAIAKNAQAMQDYKMAFEKHRGNAQDLMNEWYIIAKRHGDTVSAINMERQDIQGMLRQVETMAKMDMQMKRTDALIQQGWSRMDQMQQRLDEQKRHNAAAESARNREVQIRQQVAASKGATAKAMTPVQATMYEDVATANYRLDMLKDKAQESGELPGGSMFLQTQMHNDGLVTAVRSYGVTKVLPEGFQENDALLLGIAFDVASARSGGRGQLSDAKIREVTRQMPLESEPAKVRETKYRLIENQIEAANSTLPEQYRYDPKTKGMKGAGAGGAAGPVAPYSDPEKERRYQEWKASQGG